ncbi:hypothetical protein L1987_07755 [Smallanthus sonchifolius]|uniref:Uncharacterized protein n=1 Tax=Smallanthus sonchifolius TaxID=185202 RepID=A0ACB9JLR9_9ASTR|nr:hypothetical protein L1987_07755 [Smallanthus sonchifolius]
MICMSVPLLGFGVVNLVILSLLLVFGHYFILLFDGGGHWLCNPYHDCSDYNLSRNAGGPVQLILCEIQVPKLPKMEVYNKWAQFLGLLAEWVDHNRGTNYQWAMAHGVTSKREKQKNAGPNFNLNSKPTEVKRMGLQGGPSSGYVAAKSHLAYWAVRMALQRMDFSAWKAYRDVKVGVHILPSSIMSPPNATQQPTGQKLTTDHPNIEEKEEKDYGISNAQKMAITSRLCCPSRAVRAADMDNWDQGEHEFFEDQVKALGLDYDYSIEDVKSDDENGTSQFFAAQMKLGMPKVPLPTPTQSS